METLLQRVSVWQHQLIGADLHDNDDEACTLWMVLNL